MGGRVSENRRWHCTRCAGKIAPPPAPLGKSATPPRFASYTSQRMFHFFSQTLPDYVRNIFDHFTHYSPLIILVELLFIGVVVHLVVEFLRGTRGARLIKGAAL